MLHKSILRTISGTVADQFPRPSRKKTTALMLEDGGEFQRQFPELALARPKRKSPKPCASLEVYLTIKAFGKHVAKKSELQHRASISLKKRKWGFRLLSGKNVSFV